MTVKREVQRTCMGCRTTRNKKELIRVVRSPEGEVSVDLTGKKNGRGAYLCRNPECLKKALKNKSLARALNTPIPEEVAERLGKEIAGNDEG